ncbi:YlcI/YnfO family protein [Streptomyces violaceoruber]|uniref:YlcI/YnfO family protein n=1 Tax=Streptomyces violaceoruber TaxID=1935 RepID=UPI00403CFC50
MTKNVNVRFPDDVHQAAVDAAAADDRSLNSWLVAVVRRAAAGQEGAGCVGSAPDGSRANGVATD